MIDDKEHEMEIALLVVMAAASAFALICSVVLLTGTEETPKGRFVSGVFSILVLALFVLHLTAP